MAIGIVFNGRVAGLFCIDSLAAIDVMSKPPEASLQGP
jgi:hypothetical protein